MVKKIFLLSAWVSLALVAAATLSPLSLRPHLSDAHVEHVCAYAVIGLLFCLAYPRRVILVCAIVLGSATMLELLQLLTPDRHGRFVDLAVKIAGAMAGIVAGRIIAAGSRRPAVSDAPRSTPQRQERVAVPAD